MTEESPLQTLKYFVRAAFNVSPEALFILFGLGCYLVTCLIARRPLIWAWALVPGFCLAVALEAVEVWDHYRMRGLLMAEARDIAGIVWRHSKDVLVMNLAPLMVFSTATLLDRMTRG